MLETITAYIIILLPSITALLGAVYTVVASINKIRTNCAETKAVVDDAKNTIETIKSSPELKEMMAQIVEENKSLKKSLTLCTEELKRIHQLHPEYIEEED